MQEIQYFGEHLWPKNLGHILILLGFVSALFASFSYFKATNASIDEKKGWQNLGRVGFLTHGLSVFGIIGIIAFIMVNKYYEYAYVSQHASDTLPMKYITSAFWEGQEGSFLLWMFWHVVLGIIVMFGSKKWANPVLSILCFVEALIISMIIGIQFEVGESVVKIGSNPLLLFRDTMDIPLFKNADYVSLLSGAGLNPLLQNYWMTIHPPTLFLGFASTTLPFCYAVAGFWLSKPKEWIKPALKWALFSGGILGIGILMGGAWAYEALSFGGYWAWDPVENMSLVPWLIMVAGVHSLLIANNTGNGIKTSYIFLSLSFILILYSTFLTRSGVLGDTSVHAFTEMGLENQLILLLLSNIFIAVFVFFKRRKLVESKANEDRFDSREFWMFIGTIILLFSSILITASTSLPIYNKIIQVFDPDFVGIVINDAIPHYNKHQLWIAIFIVLLSSFSQWFRYKGKITDAYKKKLIKHISISLGLSLVFVILINLILKIENLPYFALMSISTFGIVSGIDFLVAFNKFQWKQAASIMSHLGFSIMLIGIISSGVNKKHLSSNSFVFEDIVTKERLEKNVTLIKEKPMFMNGYWVNYESDTLVNNERTYNIKFSKVDSTNKILEEFTLNPMTVFSNDKTEVVAFNPSTRHYIGKDIFSHIAGLPKQLMKTEYAREMEDTLNYQKITLSENIPFENEQFIISVQKIDFDPSHIDYEKEENDLAMGLTLNVLDKASEKSYEIKPVVALRGAVVYKFFGEINDLGTRIRINESFFESFFVFERDVDYKTVILKEGESVMIGDYTLNHKGFNRTPKNRGYQAEEGDIAVSSLLEFVGKNNEITNLEPVYVIRDSRQTSVKDFDPKSGIHAKFTHIEPSNGELEIQYSIDDRESNIIELEMANNVPRSDIIALEAILFPGINLFWLGSLMMLIGMLVAMAIRMNAKKV